MSTEGNEETAGQIFRRMRKQCRLRQEGLATTSGVAVHTIINLEAGGNPLALTVERLLEVLQPSAGEIRAYILARTPDLLSYMGERGERWLDERIEQALNTRRERIGRGMNAQEAEHGIWRILCFPALDEEWLDAQPVKKQPGLLLRAYRERFDISQTEVTKQAHIGRRGNLGAWEDGTTLMDAAKLGDIMDVPSLELTSEERARLLVVTARAFITEDAIAPRLGSGKHPNYVHSEPLEALIISVLSQRTDQALFYGAPVAGNLARLEKSDVAAILPFIAENDEMVKIVALAEACAPLTDALQGLHAVRWARKDIALPPAPRKNPHSTPEH